ncbi:MAG: C10 family peptidase [Prevotella sp.]
MKRLGLLLLLTILAFHMGFAAPRSYKQARTIALQKAASLGINNPRAALSKQSPGGTEEQEGKAYYLFDNGDNKGFVIVSGDDKLPEVIGYATSGSLSEQEMPVQLKSLLEAFEKQYKEMSGDDARLESAMAERNALAESSAAANVTVTPLLGNIEWNQLTPYNNLCPTFTNGQAVTGCVATAMAQVIRYYQYPTQLQKDIPAYTSKSGFTSSEITASSRTYDYEKMLGQYVSGNYSDEQANAVATLMYHCGCAVQMEYGVDGSSAITRSTAHVLGAYFGYDTSTLAFVDRGDYSLAEWCSIIDHELTNNRPIIYEGNTLSNAGHAFVCDGANGYGFYHINWGWGGYCNGYFDISLLNSKESESTTGAGEYNIGMGMTIGIKPSTQTGTAPIAKAKDIHASIISVSLASSDGSNTGELSGNTSFNIYNMSFNAFNGWVALAVEDKSGYKLVSDKISITGLNPYSIQGIYYFNKYSSIFNYNFPNGTTKVFVVYGSGEDIESVCGGGYDGKPYFYVTSDGTTASVSFNAFSLSATLSNEATIYNGMNNNLSLTVTNNGVQEYLDKVKVYVSSTETKPEEASNTLYLTVPANGGTATRDVTVCPTEAGNMYVWVDDVNGNSLLSAQQFTVAQKTAPVLTLVSVETNAVADLYETNRAYVKSSDGNEYYVKAPKTYDDEATFTFKVKNTGGATDSKWFVRFQDINDPTHYKDVIVEKRIEPNSIETIEASVSPADIGNSRFIYGEVYVNTDGTNTFSTPTCSESLDIFRLPIIDANGVATEYHYVINLKNCSAVYVPETTTLPTYKDNGSTYWATYSCQSSDTEIGVPTGRSVTLYNSTVSGGHLTLTPRTGDYAHKVAKGEAVLIKTDGESVKVDNLGGATSMSADTGNELIATGDTEEILTAEVGYLFYRLAYKNSESKTGLGFYLSVVNDGSTTTRDGSRIRTTPGKGYLKVANSASTEGSESSPASAFLLEGGGGDNTTDIECITVTEDNTSEDSADERVFNLQGQQVKKPVKGIYIKNNKKVVIK